VLAVLTFALCVSDMFSKDKKEETTVLKSYTLTSVQNSVFDVSCAIRASMY
jgi:hypothetical protein